MLFEDIDIKKDFRTYFLMQMGRRNLMPLFHEIFIYGAAYIVGGYFRDFLNNMPSRDLDIIVDIDNKTLVEIITNSKIDYRENRHGGVKLTTPSLEIDIWCIENNWAFKNHLVRLNDTDKLHSIAKGCFYNYDALVINLNNFSYNLRYYRDFIETKKLNILQERSTYKTLNPTSEANIIRAFFLKEILNITFTRNTFFYINKKLGHFEDRYGAEYLTRLLEVKSKYPKYSGLTDNRLKQYLQEFKLDDLPDNQLLMNI